MMKTKRSVGISNMRTFCLVYMYLVSATFMERASPDYYLMNNTYISWGYQNPPCNIASPEVVYSYYGPTINISPDLDITTADEKVFVGYTKRLMVFEYIGCIWMGHHSHKKFESYTVPSDPGQCYSVCHTIYFGIQNRMCYCLTEARGVMYDSYGNCNIGCPYPKGTVCGGRIFDYLYISVYKYVEISSSINDLDDGKYCGFADYGKYVWRDCYEQLPGICVENSSIATLSTTRNLSWSQYTRACFNHQKVPATEITINNTTTAWVGRIRSFVIEKLLPKTNYSYLGYISQQKDKFLLKFTNELSGPASVLCIEGYGVSDPQEHEHTGEDGFSVTDGYGVSDPQEHEHTGEDGFSVTEGYGVSDPQEHEHTGEDGFSVTDGYGVSDPQEHEHTGEDGFSVTVAGYVAIPVALLIVTIVVMIGIRLKRKGKHHSTGTSPAVDNDINASDFV